MSHAFSRKVQLGWLRPHGQWGIATGALIAGLALYAPAVLLEPAAKFVLPLLPFGQNIKIAILTAAISIVAVGILALAMLAYNKLPRDIGLAKPSFLHAGKALVGLLVYITISFCVQLVARQFLGLNVHQPQELGYQNLTDVDVLAAFMTLIFIIPFAEEFMFRGFLFTGFRSRLPFWAAALGVSALFGLVHGQWNVGLDVFVMSLVACYLVEKTKSLWPAIFLHMFKNMVAFYLVYLYNGG